jgi:hypothetical protein
MRRRRPAYRTRLGAAYVGDCSEVLKGAVGRSIRGRVQLLFTSPPFVLNRKKRYGNLQGEAYVDWLTTFAVPFRDLLAPTGSVVIELGNAWEPGQPTMSTLAIEALLAFKKAGDFHLCQEFVCFNPAKLPTPAQWVTVERCRVKDAFTRVWWLSTTAKPKADNRRVLTQYSEAMHKLLIKGTYNAGRRPSEHRVGKKSFLRRHDGAIPPNVLISPFESLSEWLTAPLDLLPNTNTTNFGDVYWEHCRKNGIDPHPARMPAGLVEFFVRFLTDERDLVLDPFAGSNTTGATAESLKRRWIAIEINEEYLRPSRSRFDSVRRRNGTAPTSPGGEQRKLFAAGA